MAAGGCVDLVSIDRASNQIEYEDFAITNADYILIDDDTKPPLGIPESVKPRIVNLSWVKECLINGRLLKCSLLPTNPFR